MKVLCLCLLALGHVNRGEPQAGVNAGRAALDISLEINNMWAQVYSVLNLNHALLEVGEYEEALRVTQQGVAMARTLPNPTLLFFMLTVLGAVHQAMLQLEEAHEALIESLAISSTIAVRSYKVLATSRLCANRALAGDWKTAYTYALETVAVRKDIETSLLFIDFIRYYETEALLRGGDEEWAREDVQRLGARITTNRRLRLPYLRALATLPSLDELRSKIIGLLNAPATKLAVLLQTPGSQLARVLAAHAEEGGAGKAAAAAAPAEAAPVAAEPVAAEAEPAGDEPAAAEPDGAA
jgi:tetratricopeptide (TPR) repeat protein